METEFKKFLERSNHARSTVDTYSFIISKLIKESKELSTFNYREVIELLGRKNNAVTGSSYKQTIVAALKRYYTFLNQEGIREDHPCRTLTLKAKSSKEIISSDLLTMSEMSLLLNREERYTFLNLRNKVLFSLMIFQGLTPQEIMKLKVENIFLYKGYIYIPRSRKLTNRKLAIDPRQKEWIENYLETERPALLNKSTEILLLGKTGLPITCDAIHYIVSTAQALFPSKELTAVTIRQSVIAHWLNELGIPLEQVQLMAGHKWISSTQRYLFHSIEEDLKVLRRVHPMGRA